MNVTLFTYLMRDVASYLIFLIELDAKEWSRKYKNW